jgi:hypothetical protein
LAYVVAYIGSADPEDNVLGDVGGVICDSLQITGNQQRVQGLTGLGGLLVHAFDQIDESFVAHAVDHIVHLEHGLRQLSFGLDKGFQSSPHHGTGGGSHAWDIHRQVYGGQFNHIHYALGDIDALVSDAFQVRVDFGNRKDEAQVCSHGLLHGQQVESQFIDFPLRGIDLAFTFKNQVATGKVAFNVGLTCPIHRLFRKTAHAQQFLPKLIETLLKASAHYPNLPVM